MFHPWKIPFLPEDFIYDVYDHLLEDVYYFPFAFGEMRSHSTMSGYSDSNSFSVQTSSNNVNGKHIQNIVIEGNGISERLKYQSPSSMSLSVFNADGILVIADEGSDKFLIFSDTPGTLIIMRDGVCTEKKYRGSGSTSRQISDKECQAIRRKASEELEKNRVYWDNWSKDFNKNMQDTFPPGFPFQNQQQSSGSSSMFSGNLWGGLADMGLKMQKSLFSGFPFSKKK